MKIKSIAVYQVALPYPALGSRWLGRDKPAQVDSSIVIITTESDLTGTGESDKTIRQRRARQVN